MPTKNQIHIKRNDIQINEDELLELPKGTITEVGVRKNINVGILYIESWLMGVGAAALYHLMEDAATAEISRAQLWLWLKKQAKTNSGIEITKELYQQFIVEELEKIKIYVGVERFEKGKFELASILFRNMIESNELDDFLTLKAYEYLD